MKKPIKAVLLSALVIPGAGHIFLKKYLTASFLVITSLIPVTVLANIAIKKALVITDGILKGQINSDLATITSLISKQTTEAEATMSSIATIALLVIWFIGIADSYRVGKLQENQFPN